MKLIVALFLFSFLSTCFNLSQTFCLNSKFSLNSCQIEYSTFWHCILYYFDCANLCFKLEIILYFLEGFRQVLCQIYKLFRRKQWKHNLSKPVGKCWFSSLLLLVHTNQSLFWVMLHEPVLCLAPISFRFRVPPDIFLLYSVTGSYIHFGLSFP